MQGGGTEIIMNLKNYFSKAETALWSSSAAIIIAFFFVFDRESYMTLAASLIGVTSLILNAKGNPIGQFLTVVFSLFYGIISFTFRYYGEMLTYLGMTMPMAIVALVSWIKNPYKGNKAEVKINRITKKEAVFMWLAAALVTFIFYFVLEFFSTANIVPSTVSVTTSFIAVYLTFKRDPRYAIGYATNDIVLIVLWVLAAVEDIGYISVAACFAAFLANDIYGFYNWKRMEKRQSLNL